MHHTPNISFGIILGVLICLSGISTFAQLPATSDTVNQLARFYRNLNDSLKTNIRSVIDLRSKPANLIDSEKIATINKTLAKSFKQINSTSLDSITKSKFSIIKSSFTKPLFQLTGGYIAYNLNFRKIVDTPLLEKNILQNTLNGNLNFSIGSLPFQLNYLLRRSNSVYFRDLNDVQLIFDVQRFQHNLNTKALNKVLQNIESVKESTAGELSKMMEEKYLSYKSVFNSLFDDQKIAEARERLNVPELTWDKSIPDSMAEIKSDSLKKIASDYLKLYDESINKLNELKYRKDSVAAVYEASVKKVSELQSLLKGDNNLPGRAKAMLTDSIMRKYGTVPSKYRWIFGIKRFSLGRTSINHSELTAKNLSLKGINFEYNSWYYFAVSAGLVDYRFKDFNIQGIGQRPKQYFFMGRIGLGNILRNYFTISVFNGRKQIFASGAVGNLYSINTKGLSLEGKFQLNKLNYIKVEVAESFAPDFRKNPVENKKWRLDDKTNKAFAISIHLAAPRIHARLDAVYKYIGANYQSFSSFQTNSAQNILNVKVEKFFFRKQFRITGGLRSNEFSNPYLPISYQSNTIFKTLQVTLRKKMWPVLTAGYMPMTQLTNMGGVVVENKFNALNGTVFHNYKISQFKISTTAIFSRFYNTNADTGFIYFNAQNILVNQVFYFGRYNASINISRSTNKNYELNVMDENLQIPFNKSNSMMFGVKISNLNKRYIKTGLYGNIQLTFLKNAIMRLQWEDGYIPGMNGTLVKNTIGTVQLSKNF